jgi:predicted RNA-binding Zn-ribbon protein involved in translation (DUF1610 family)
LDEVKRAIDKRQAAKNAIGDSTRGLEKTIGQLIELQRLGIEKEKAFSAEEQAAFADNLKLFLENQKRDQSLSQEIVGLVEERTNLEQQQREVGDELERQRRPAREEYDNLYAAHKLRLAMYQLLVLSPFLAIATWLCVRKRSSPYFPIYVAVAAAALIQVGLVLHRYFPNRLFKYGFLFVLLAVVLRLLIQLIRNAVHPARDTLLKQYREAYERFRCPNCEYPIRRGPMRFATWSRKTVKNLARRTAEEDQPYVCPSCGTKLFEECAACHQVRPALLPHCDHCGTASNE